MDLCEFKTSLAHVLSSGPVRATKVRPCLPWDMEPSREMSELLTYSIIVTFSISEKVQLNEIYLDF